MTQIIRRLILAAVLMAGLAPAFGQAPPPVPALPDAPRLTTYSISGSTCACAVGFQLYGDGTDYANWVQVYVNGILITQSGNWTITSPTGSLATIPRPITDAVLTFTTAQTGTVQIIGARRPRRTSQFSESRGVAARDMNQVLSDLTAQLRENWDLRGRMYLAPPGSTGGVISGATGVFGPATSTDKGIARYVGTGGGTIQNSTTTLDDNGYINGPGFKSGAITTIPPSSGSGGTMAVTATAPIVLNSSTGNISCPSCATSAPASNAYFATSRTAAIAQDLSTYSVVQTGGYASGNGDGSAIFKNVGSAAYLDSHVATGSITAGSGYTNGTYRNVWFQGGTGSNFIANVTITGGAVTGVTCINACGFGYTAADVLTPVSGNSLIGGTGSGFSYTVSTVTSPLASFADSAGNHWQYVPQGVIHAKQFGCKFDWNKTTGDAGATDDTACMREALKFSSYVTPDNLQTSIAQAFGGYRLILPAGTALISDSLTQFGSSVVEGQGPFNTFLKVADTGLSSGAGANVWNICDPSAHVACFGPLMRNFGFAARTTQTPSNGTFVIFTNAAQQMKILENVAVYSGKRGCLNYDTGYGGAANAAFQDLFCTIDTGAVSDAILLSNIGTTIVQFKDVVVESGGAGFTGNGFNAATGNTIIDGLHSEGIATPVNVNLTVATHSLLLKNASGGNGCTSLVKLQVTNTLGNMSIENAVKNGCTKLVIDGQPAGSDRSADVIPANGLVSFNP